MAFVESFVIPKSVFLSLKQQEKSIVPLPTVNQEGGGRINIKRKNEDFEKYLMNKRAKIDIVESQQQDTPRDEETILKMFPIHSQHKVYRLLKLIKKHKSLINWDPETYELNIFGKHYPDSNIVDIMAYLIGMGQKGSKYPYLTDKFLNVLQNTFGEDIYGVGGMMGTGNLGELAKYTGGKNKEELKEQIKHEEIEKAKERNERKNREYDILESIPKMSMDELEDALRTEKEQTNPSAKILEALRTQKELGQILNQKKLEDLQKIEKTKPTLRRIAKELIEDKVEEQKKKDEEIEEFNFLYPTENFLVKEDYPTLINLLKDYQIKKNWELVERVQKAINYKKEKEEIAGKLKELGRLDLTDLRAMLKSEDNEKILELIKQVIREKEEDERFRAKQAEKRELELIKKREADLALQEAIKKPEKEKVMKPEDIDLVQKEQAVKLPNDDDDEDFKTPPADIQEINVAEGGLPDDIELIKAYEDEYAAERKKRARTQVKKFDEGHQAQKDKVRQRLASEARSKKEAEKKKTKKDG